MLLSTVEPGKIETAVYCRTISVGTAVLDLKAEWKRRELRWRARLLLMAVGLRGNVQILH